MMRCRAMRSPSGHGRKADSGAVREVNQGCIGCAGDGVDEKASGSGVSRPILTRSGRRQCPVKAHYQLEVTIRDFKSRKRKGGPAWLVSRFLSELEVTNCDLQFNHLLSDGSRRSRSLKRRTTLA